MTPKELEAFLHDQIPLAASLGVRIIASDENGCELRAPLDPNRNHLGTAFGGSLGAVLILAGYVWLFHALERRGSDCHLLLKTSRTEYKRPVQSELVAICKAPIRADLDAFLKTFEKKGLARIHLEAIVPSESGPACLFSGEFVAQRANESRLG